MENGVYLYDAKANVLKALLKGDFRLFCASEGLATVVRGSVDRKALAEALQLPENKRVTFAQTVGYPAAEAR